MIAGENSGILNLSNNEDLVKMQEIENSLRKNISGVERNQPLRASSSVVSQTASNTNHNLIHQNSYSLNMSASSYNNAQSKTAF